MKNNSLLLLVLLLCTFCNQPKEDTPTSGSLRALTCESQAAIMMQVKQQFETVYPDTKISLAATTTRNAIVELLNDSVRLICTDRPLNAEENAVAAKANLKIQEIRVAEDALAIIVHPDNPIKQITQRMLSEIVSGAIKEWKSVPESKMMARIQLALTGRNSGTYELLMKRFLKLDTDAAVTVTAEAQDSIVDYVKTHVNAIAVVPVSAIRHDSSTVKALDLESVDSVGNVKFVRMHQANIARELYPFHYPVYIYLNTGRKGVGMGFSTFIASAPGQKYFLDAGLVPKKMPVRLVQLHEE